MINKLGQPLWVRQLCYKAAVTLPLPPADVDEDTKGEGEAGDAWRELVLLGEAGQGHRISGDGGGGAKVDQEGLRHVEEEFYGVGPWGNALFLFMYEAYLTTERRIRGRRRRGRTRLPATMVSTNQPSWPKASAGAFSVITLVRFPSLNGLNLV